MNQLELLKEYQKRFNEYTKTAEQHQFMKLMFIDMMLQKSIADAEVGKMLNETNLEALKKSMKQNCDIEVD